MNIKLYIIRSWSEGEERLLQEFSGTILESWDFLWRKCVKKCKFSIRNSSELLVFERYELRATSAHRSSESRLCVVWVEYSNLSTCPIFSILSRYFQDRFFDINLWVINCITICRKNNRQLLTHVCIFIKFQPLYQNIFRTIFLKIVIQIRVH